MYISSRKFNETMFLKNLSIHLLLLSDTIFEARLTRVFETLPLQAITLGTIVILSVSYAVLMFIRFKTVEYVSFTLGATVIYLSVSHFSRLTGEIVVQNAIFQYIVPFTFVIFCAMRSPSLQLYACRTLAFYVTMYMCMYTSLAALNVVGALPSSILDAITSEDQERGARIYMYAGAASYAWFYWLVDMQKNPNFRNRIFFLICLFGISMSLSRTLILCLGIITVFRLLKYKNADLRGVILFILSVVWAFNLFGIINHDFNPFSFFSGDSSGDFRFSEFEVARKLIREDIFFGVGLPTSSDGISIVTGNEFFFAGDLGIAGIWLEYGLLGMALFVAGSFFVTYEIKCLPDEVRQPMFLLGCFLASYGVIAPVIFDPGGATYFGAIVGLRFACRSREGSTQGKLNAGTHC